MMKLKVTLAVELDDEYWGFSDNMEGRSIEDKDAQADLIELIMEDTTEIFEKCSWNFEIVEG